MKAHEYSAGECRYPRRFRDPKLQQSYEDARRRHDDLYTRSNVSGDLYRAGYNSPERQWQPDSAGYPIWCAGRDNRRCAEKSK